MNFRTFAAAGEFLHAVGETLYAAEAENSLLLGITLRVRDGYSYGSEPPLFACVEDGGRFPLITVRTPPYNLLLCADAPDREALALVTRHLAAAGVALPGAQGRATVVDAFAEIWKVETGTDSSVAMEQRLYRLTSVARPADVAGRARWAVPEDTRLLVSWGLAFVGEAVPGDPKSSIPTMVENAIADQRLLVWDDDGVVSMCAQTRPTPHGASVGLVYTPPTLRGCGYASACVAELSQRTLDSGKAFCTLFTDLSNPISNSIYQRIGYRPLGDFREIRFAAP